MPEPAINAALDLQRDILDGRKFLGLRQEERQRINQVLSMLWAYRHVAYIDTAAARDVDLWGGAHRGAQSFPERREDTQAITKDLTERYFKAVEWMRRLSHDLTVLHSHIPPARWTTDEATRQVILSPLQGFQGNELPMKQIVAFAMTGAMATYICDLRNLLADLHLNEHEFWLQPYMGLPIDEEADL